MHGRKGPASNYVHSTQGGCYHQTTVNFEIRWNWSVNDPDYDVRGGVRGGVHGGVDGDVSLSQMRRIRMEICGGGDHYDHSLTVWALWTDLVCCARTQYGLQGRNVTFL
mmetsp:Transcript_27667/g.66535  ORF Transcript_27667/g.66535 Transcript_27667/m.66535 type:complete len:109 (+) Transcript_27667:4410-4736(+)